MSDDIPQPRQSPKVYLETFGCQMNVLDSQLVSNQLQALGYTFIDDWKDADIVLYNTCSVREKAEQKVWSRVGEVGIHKREHPEMILGIIGCMAERDGIDMTRRYPQVDLMCGPGELDKVPTLVDNVLKTSLLHRGGVKNAQVALQGNSQRRSKTLAAAEDQLELIDLSRSFSPDEHTNHSAYVRITRGCNKFCTYCVVPNTRGREIHRPPQHIIDECKKLADNGVIEVTLLGQTVNHYHYDNSAAQSTNGILQPQIGTVIAPNKGNGGPSPEFGEDVTSFANLLYEIHEQVPDLERIRFVTSLPRDFGNDILQVIRDCPRLCEYLHLPVQSGSNRILKLMNRGYSVEEYKDLIHRVHDILPNALLATDIICGFPTETEEDHRATADLLRYCKFKNSFIFKYSPRPDTVAASRFEDDIPNDIKKRRNNELLGIQSEISQQIHEQFVDKTVSVFIESISSKEKREQNSEYPSVTLGWQQDEQETVQLSGRTEGDLIVIFRGAPYMIGTIQQVTIKRAAPLTLFGKLQTEPALV